MSWPPDYGRMKTPLAHKTITDICCHGQGAFGGNLDNRNIRILRHL